MALQFSHVTEQGFTATAAYARISNITVKHRETDVQTFLVDIFYDQAAYTNGNKPLVSLNLDRTFDDTAAESFATYYAYLKSLPEFAGAVDV